jgi:ribulose-5-phosphate 4-epimerase/fuculose-1-phosphate aldolase
MFKSKEKRAQLPAALGSAQVLMLRNHGPLVIGSTHWECFSRMYYLERACRMQVTMMSAVRDPAGDLVWPHPADCELMAKAFDEPSQEVARREWDALKRMLDRTDGSYRH